MYKPCVLPLKKECVYDYLTKWRKMADTRIKPVAFGLRHKCQMQNPMASAGLYVWWAISWKGKKNSNNLIEKLPVEKKVLIDMINGDT